HHHHAGGLRGADAAGAGRAGAGRGDGEVDDVVVGRGVGVADVLAAPQVAVAEGPAVGRRVAGRGAGVEGDELAGLRRAGAELEVGEEVGPARAARDVDRAQAGGAGALAVRRRDVLLAGGRPGDLDGVGVGAAADRPARGGPAPAGRRGYADGGVGGEGQALAGHAGGGTADEDAGRRAAVLVPLVDVQERQGGAVEVGAPADDLPRARHHVVEAGGVAAVVPAPVVERGDVARVRRIADVEEPLALGAARALVVGAEIEEGGGAALRVGDVEVGAAGVELAAGDRAAEPAGAAGSDAADVVDLAVGVVAQAEVVLGPLLPHGDAVDRAAVEPGELEVGGRRVGDVPDLEAAGRPRGEDDEVIDAADVEGGDAGAQPALIDAGAVDDLAGRRHRLGAVVEGHGRRHVIDEEAAVGVAAGGGQEGVLAAAQGCRVDLLAVLLI